jgi:uncharacterized coiled-coil protein SlyX
MIVNKTLHCYCSRKFKILTLTTEANAMTLTISFDRGIHNLGVFHQHESNAADHPEDRIGVCRWGTKVFRVTQETKLIYRFLFDIFSKLGIVYTEATVSGQARLKQIREASVVAVKPFLDKHSAELVEQIQRLTQENQTFRPKAESFDAVQAEKVALEKNVNEVLQPRITQLETDLATAGTTEGENNQTINNLNTTVTEHQAKINQLELALTAALKTILDNDPSVYKTEIDTLKAELAAAKNDNTSLNADKTASQKAVEDQKKVSEKLKDQIDALKLEVVKLKKHSQEQLESEKTKNTSLIEDLKAANQQLIGEKEDLIKKQTAELQAATKLVEEANSNAQASKKDADAARRETKGFQLENAELKKQIALKTTSPATPTPVTEKKDPVGAPT